MVSVDQLFSFLTHNLYAQAFDLLETSTMRASHKSAPPHAQKTPQSEPHTLVFEALASLSTESPVPLLSQKLSQDLAKFFAQHLDKEGNLLLPLASQSNRTESLNLTLSAKIENEPSASTWQVYLIPLRNEQEMHLLRLYIPKETHHQDQEEEPAKRFLAEFSFERWGFTQIEGLLTHTIFQLSFRNFVDFGDEIKSELRNLFGDLLNKLKKTGQIYFEGQEKIKKISIKGSPSDQTFLSL